MFAGAWQVRICAALMAYAGGTSALGGLVETHTNPLPTGSITIDGNVTDWSGVAPYAADAANDAAAGVQNWVRIWISHDETNLYFRVDRSPGSVSFSAGVGGGSTGGYGYWIILDTDRNRSTGLRTASGRPFSIGGEFNFGGARALNAWGAAGNFLGPLAYERVENGNTLEISVPRATLGDPDAFDFIMVGETSADYYPDGSASADYFRYVMREPPPAPPMGEIAVRSNPLPHGAITIDGQLSDWAAVSPFPPDAAGDVTGGEDFVQAWIAHDDASFYFRLQRSPQGSAFPSTHGYWVLMDADGDATTGLAGASGRTFSIGAEYNLASFLEFNIWAAGGCVISSVVPEQSAVSADGLTLEIAIPQAAMKWTREFRVIYVGEHSADYYPDGAYSGAWFRYATTICHAPSADHDGDGDVDQDDFGAFQACMGAAPASEALPVECRCFDRTADNAVDLMDFARFQACASGAAVPTDPACEQPDPPETDFFKHFVQLPAAPGPLPQPLPAGSSPGFSIRGIKGWNWTAGQYLATVPYLAQHQMNFMMNCYLSIFSIQGGNKWWLPLPDNAKADYQQIINACSQSGVNFCFCMNPQLSSSRPLDPTSDADFEQLWQNYAWAQSAGVHWFCVSLDDISGVPIVGAQHASLVNRLLDRLQLADPQAQMVFCPTWYWGDGSTGHDYLTALGANLDPDVYVFWTGDAVVTPKITVAAATSYRAVVQHRLVLWDNYPVNDGSQTLHLGPVIGRDAHLGEILHGYMSNPLYPQDQANRIPMLTCADYAYNPLGYDPYRSIGQAIVHLAPTAEGRLALKDLVEAYPGMVGFECGSFGTGYNPVRSRYLNLAADLTRSGAYVDHLRDLSARLAAAFPGTFQDARATLDADIAWMAQDHENRGGG